MSDRGFSRELPAADSGPRQTRIELSGEELVRRCGAEAPHVMLVDEMHRGRIIWEAFEAPNTRRVVVYAMHPQTYHRAIDTAYERWGVVAKNGIEGTQPAHHISQGNEIVIPIFKPMWMLPPPDGPPDFSPSYYEWRIRL